MRRNLTALLLVLAMALSLAACGRGNTDDNGRDSQNNNPSSAGGGDSGPAVSGGNTSDSRENSKGAGIPGLPGGGIIVAGAPGGGADTEREPDENSPGGSESNEEPRASSTDVTLFHAGESFRLTPEGVDDGYTATYASQDQSVATVDANGTVTAVAPGTTAITLHVECGEGTFDFSCRVRCRWEVETEGAGASAQPTLSEFYDTVTASYTFGSMGAVEGEVLDSWYPGLASASGVEEILIMEPVIGFSTAAMALVRMSEGAAAQDIQAVKDILQARIDSQAGGGAYYLQAVDSWGQGVVTAVGRYVGMFVHGEESQEIADLFTDAYGG